MAGAAAVLRSGPDRHGGPKAAGLRESIWPFDGAPSHERLAADAEALHAALDEAELSTMLPNRTEPNRTGPTPGPT